MSPDDWEMIEIDKLKAHLAAGYSLLEKVKEIAPDPIELMALSALLHGFYTGIENICRIVARSFGEIMDVSKASEGWHQKLLNSLNDATEKRPALLSQEMYYSLLEYLRFRHVFRRAYQQEIRWNRMKNLTINMPFTLDRFIRELNAFRSNINNSE